MISYGRDPYNHDCSILERVANQRMFRAMERAFKDCCTGGSKPELIWASDEVMAALRDAVENPDRGHEFLPYG